MFVCSVVEAWRRYNGASTAFLAVARHPAHIVPMALGSAKLQRIILFVMLSEVKHLFHSKRDPSFAANALSG